MKLPLHRCHGSIILEKASYKPYVIAAMILLARKADPADTLMRLLEEGKPRIK